MIQDKNTCVRYRRLKLDEVIRDGDMQFIHPPVNGVSDRKIEEVNIPAHSTHIGKTTEEAYPDPKIRNCFYRLKKIMQTKPKSNQTLRARLTAEPAKRHNVSWDDVKWVSGDDFVRAQTDAMCDQRATSGFYAGGSMNSGMVFTVHKNPHRNHE